MLHFVVPVTPTKVYGEAHPYFRRSLIKPLFNRWDTRNMNEPTDTMIIDLVKTPNDVQCEDNALAISALEYEPTIPTR